MPTHGLNNNPLFEDASASSSQPGRDGAGPDPLQLLNAELQGYVKKQSNKALEASKWNIELSLQKAKTSEQKEIRRLEGVVKALETTSQNMHGRMHKLEEVCASLQEVVTSLQSTIQNAGISAADMQLLRQLEVMRASEGLTAMDLPRNSSASSLDLQQRVPFSHSRLARGVLPSDPSYAVHEDNLMSSSQGSTPEQPCFSPLRTHSHLARGALPSDPSYTVCNNNLSSSSQRLTSEDNVQGHGGHGIRGRSLAVPAPGNPRQPLEPGAWTDASRPTRRARFAEGTNAGNGTSNMRRGSTCAVFSERIPGTHSQLARLRTGLQQAPASSEASSPKSRGSHSCKGSCSSRALLDGGSTEGQLSPSRTFQPHRRTTSDRIVGHKYGEEVEEEANESKGLHWRMPLPKSTHNKSLQVRNAEGRAEGMQGGSFRWMASRRFTSDGCIGNGKDPRARQGTGARKGHRLKPTAEDKEEDDDLGFLMEHPRVKFGEMSHWADAHERMSAKTVEIQRAGSF